MAVFVVYEAKIISEEKALIPMRILRRLSNNASLLVCFMHGSVRTGQEHPSVRETH